MDDKRKQGRISFREPVQYQFKNSGQFGEKDLKYFGAGLTCDLSDSGIRIRSNDFLPLHADLLLDFHLDPEQPVDAEGEVVWVQKMPHAESYQFGVKFSAASRDVLIRELQNYSESSVIPTKSSEIERSF